MKAAVLKENGLLQVEERPIPSPAADEYLVKIDAVGICNSDIFRAHASGAYHYPLVMGHEMCGEIVEAGANVSELSPGQNVVIFPLIPCRDCDACKKQEWVFCSNYDYFGSRRDGGYQEYLTVREWNLLPISSDKYSTLHCLTEPIAVGLHAASMIADVVEGKDIALFGAGLIGMTIALNLKERGANVLVVDRNKFKLDLLSEFVFDTMTTENATDDDAIFDIVFEVTGAEEIYRRSTRVCKVGGTVVWVGNIHGDLTILQKEVSSILRKELTIKGVWNSDYQRGVNDDWEKAVRFINSHTIYERIVNLRMPLDDLGSTLESLYDAKRGRSGIEIIKAVLDFGL